MRDAAEASRGSASVEGGWMLVFVLSTGRQGGAGIMHIPYYERQHWQLAQRFAPSPRHPLPLLSALVTRLTDCWPRGSSMMTCDTMTTDLGKRFIERTSQFT